MKVKQQNLKVALAVAIPVAVVGGYILEQRQALKASRFRARYMEEKLNSALTKLTPEKLEEMSDEVDKDIRFFHLAQTELKDTL